VTNTIVEKPADLLATIVAATRRIVEVRQAAESLSALANRAERRAARPGRFKRALQETGRVNVIAECKRRSPSKGVLRNGYDPVAIAKGYEAAGAAAVSVLTEPTFFDGSMTDLENVAAAVGVPALRKDFIVSEYQLFEAKAVGADAVLLIAAALSAQELKSLAFRAATLGLDALVEVHDERDLGQAVEAGAEIVGVNNRNLRSLKVDLQASEELIGRIPTGVVAVSESGLKTPADLERLMALGYGAFLIGERFMTASDPGDALRHLLGAAAAAKDVGGMKASQ
jgi:indole-3-glycerol phosphate synthase